MKLRHIIAPALIFSMTGISSVSAQNNDSDERVVFEEIFVTATKREQNIYEVPVAVTAFTADTIERAGIVDINDVGKFVPNLTITNFSAGQTSSANPFIRGIGLQDHLITTRFFSFREC